MSFYTPETTNPPALVFPINKPSVETRQKLLRTAEINIPSASELTQQSIKKARDSLPAELRGSKMPKGVQQIINDYNRLTNYPIGNIGNFNLDPINGKATVFFGE